MLALALGEKQIRGDESGKRTRLSVSKISVPSRYRGVTFRTSLVGAICQRPFSGVHKMAAKHAPESNRGRQSQSKEPSLVTNAAVWQSPIRAYSSMRLVIDCSRGYPHVPFTIRDVL
jgi:hypothetical protein